MSRQTKRRLPGDAERLFQKMVLLSENEGDGEFCDRYPLTSKFLKYLGFPTTEAVEKAADQIRMYAHQDGWCHPMMDVKNDELFCGPDVRKSWDSYNS